MVKHVTETSTLIKIEIQNVYNLEILCDDQVLLICYGDVMKLQYPKCFSVKGKNGEEVMIDLTKLKASSKQKKILNKLIAQGDHSNFNKDEWDEIKDLKAVIGSSGGPEALIVRFDWTWVRIDEKSLRYKDVVK